MGGQTDTGERRTNNMDVSVNYMKDDIEVSIHLNNVVKIELEDGKIVATDKNGARLITDGEIKASL